MYSFAHLLDRKQRKLCRRSGTPNYNLVAWFPRMRDAASKSVRFARALQQRRPAHVRLGQKRRIATGAGLRSMSALPPKADIANLVRYVRFVPKADSCTAANTLQNPDGLLAKLFLAGVP